MEADAGQADSSTEAGSSLEAGNSELEPVTVDMALERIGFGRFQVAVMFFCGWAWAVDSVEGGGFSFVYVAVDKEWGTDTRNWGLLNSVKNITGVVGALCLGTVADKFGRRPALLAAISICAVFGLASAAAPDFPTLIALRAVANLGSGAILPVATSLLAEHVPPSSRESCTILMQIFYSSGYVLAVVISLCLPGGSWRLFLAALAMPSALLLLAWPLVPESPVHLHQAGEEKKLHMALRRMCRVNGGDPDTLAMPERAVPCGKAKAKDEARGLHRLCSDRQLARRAAAFGLLWALAVVGSDYMGWITELGEAHGYTKREVASFMIAAKVNGVPAFLFAAWCARCGGGALALRAALVACAVTCSAWAVAVKADSPSLVVGGSLITLIFPYDMVWALLYASTASAFDPLCRASALGVSICFSRVSNAFTPLLSGYLLKTNETAALTLWTLAWATAAMHAACGLPSASAPDGGGASSGGGDPRC